MLTLTTPEGHRFTANTDVRLASLWADARHWSFAAVAVPLFVSATLWSGALATYRGVELRGLLFVGFDDALQVHRLLSGCNTVHVVPRS